ncbi:hypothetical protein [Streptomyces sp. A1547]|uniref:hypothetical protein n=1 Tax=Streptomyces sp. A1547 TaxID=2563105 RepID=UPI00144AA08A|nr:hypothetical protein [Streptomyces sp. A1547]
MLYGHAVRAFAAAKEGPIRRHLRPEDVYAALSAESRPDGVDGVIKASCSLVE